MASQRFIFVCHTCNNGAIRGCYVNGVERYCVTCVSWDNCWIDTWKGDKIPETGRTCQKCHDEWVKRLNLKRKA